MSDLTPEQGYEIAKYQRPGFKIAMGPHAARDEPTTALPDAQIYALPGDFSWPARDLRLRLGFEPSSWATWFAGPLEEMGLEVTNNELKWLNGPATLKEARAWLLESFFAPTHEPKESNK